MVAMGLVVVALAGCAQAPDGTGPEDRTKALGAGLGAIAGLLVDDRFRPLELTDKPETEFQRAGFLLVAETGDEVKTNENGEFFVFDLRPGTYTLRPSVKGHEGVPAKVEVRAGAIAEVSLVVRRIASPGEETLFVRDDTLLITCQVQFINGRANLDRACYGDLSNEGHNEGLYLEFPQGLDYSWLVTEVHYSQQLGWDFWFMAEGGVLASEESFYHRDHVPATDYYRIAHPHSDDPFSEPTWDGYTNEDGSDPPHVNVTGVRVAMYPNHLGSDETYGVVGNFEVSVGMTFQVKARMINSAFVGEPDTDVASYCVLCR